MYICSVGLISARLDVFADGLQFHLHNNMGRTKELSNALTPQVGCLRCVTWLAKRFFLFLNSNNRSYVSTTGHSVSSIWINFHMKCNILSKKGSFLPN